MLLPFQQLRYCFCLVILYKKNVKHLSILNPSRLFSPWDLGQVDIKLGTKPVIYQKLANFMYKTNIRVNRFESIIFGMQICILQTRIKCKKGTSQNWTLKACKYRKEIYQRIEFKRFMKKSGHLSNYHAKLWSLKCQNWLSFFVFSADGSKISLKGWAKTDGKIMFWSKMI